MCWSEKPEIPDRYRSVPQKKKQKKSCIYEKLFVSLEYQN